MGEMELILEGLEGVGHAVDRLGTRLDDVEGTVTKAIAEMDAKFSRRLDSQDDTLAAHTVRFDELGLNGQGPAIKALAAVSPKLVAIAEYTTPLIAEAKERSERTEFRVLLAKRLRIPKLTKAFYVVIGFALAGLSSAIAQHYIGH